MHVRVKCSPDGIVLCIFSSTFCRHFHGIFADLAEEEGMTARTEYGYHFFFAAVLVSL